MNVDSFRSTRIKWKIFLTGKLALLSPALATLEKLKQGKKLPRYDCYIMDWLGYNYGKNDKELDEITQLNSAMWWLLRQQNFFFLLKFDYTYLVIWMMDGGENIMMEMITKVHPEWNLWHHWVKVPKNKNIIVQKSNKTLLMF